MSHIFVKYSYNNLLGSPNRSAFWRIFVYNFVEHKICILLIFNVFTNKIQLALI